MKKTINHNLISLAKEFYYREVKAERYRNNFIQELEKRKVIDKRELGFYCSHCGKFSINEMAFTRKDKVIFPKNNKTELWLVNSHYDGCMGWD